MGFNCWVYVLVVETDQTQVECLETRRIWLPLWSDERMETPSVLASQVSLVPLSEDVLGQWGYGPVNLSAVQHK
jgi:hypothetical protein